MDERKSLFDAIKDVCEENDCLHEENNWLREKIKRLKEEIDNGERMRFVYDAYVKKLLKERNDLREEIDDKDEIIQSLHDEIEARCTFTKKVIKERDAFCDEMKLMVKDHEVECDDYCTMISEMVNIDELHSILAKYLTDNYTDEPTKICFFQFLDEIKKFIDSNKKEC